MPATKAALPGQAAAGIDPRMAPESGQVGGMPPGRLGRWFHGRSSDFRADCGLLVIPSRPWPVDLITFVPDYRCATVPDSHRIPFYPFP